MTQPTILVTGGAGYIGSHTAKALAAAGYRPVVFDNLSNGHRPAVRWGPFVHGDVRDAAGLAAAMSTYAVSAVIHFAGLIEVGRSVQDPQAYWDHNVGGMAAVLSAMRASDVDRLVFSSTAATYGLPNHDGVLSETDVTAPINPYGDSKLASERMIANACAAYGLTGVALRYFNAAGASGDGEIGEAHAPETHLIPLAIEAALGLGPPLRLFGTDFPTPDGSCIRDYVHVEDLACAHVAALGLARPDTGFLAMNLGTGTGHSVREVIAAVSRCVGAPCPFTLADRRAGDPPRLVADPSLARARLGWRARHTDLDAVIASAVAWRRDPAFGPMPPILQAA